MVLFFYSIYSVASNIRYFSNGPDRFLTISLSTANMGRLERGRVVAVVALILLGRVSSAIKR